VGRSRTVCAAWWQRAAAVLERHRPDGPCDDTCGCVVDTSSTPASAISRATKPDPIEVPIACTLPPDLMGERLDDWQAVLSHVTGRSALAHGVRLELADGTPLDELVRLVAAEQACCQFFQLAITVDARGAGLEVRGPDDARAVIGALFGG
jgi:hypothetical protein